MKRRGGLIFWLDEAALAGWHAPRRRTPGGQPVYSELAIELVLTLRLVFHLALRQAEVFTASVLRLLGHALGVPDHTTLSRRGRGFANRQPRVLPGESRPVHLVLDSTGLQLFGQGEWDAEAHASPHSASMTDEEKESRERLGVYERTQAGSPDVRSVMSGWRALQAARRGGSRSCDPMHEAVLCRPKSRSRSRASTAS